MPTTEVSPAATEPETSDNACTVCPHPWNAHDPIGIRYCSAMAASGIVRGCACVDKTSVGKTSVDNARREDQTRKNYYVR